MNTLLNSFYMLVLLGVLLGVVELPGFNATPNSATQMVILTDAATNSGAANATPNLSTWNELKKWLPFCEKGMNYRPAWLGCVNIDPKGGINFFVTCKDSYILDRCMSAVCLDGSPGAYYFTPGSGSGSNNWIIELEGGGWCTDTYSCSMRANSSLGSSVISDASGVNQIMSSGIMNSNAQSNPDFYNWNMVFVLYCDGASFSGDVDAPVEVPQGNIYFRGQRIWDAVITDLLDVRGMYSAENALLTGCSAGALAALLHCDQFRARMPDTTFVKCFSDAGFFLDQKDVDGDYTLRESFQSVVALQNVASNLLPECIYARDTSEAWQCFFPQYFIQYIQTPFHIFNSGYDSWQVEESLIPMSDWSPLNGAWRDCFYNFSSCSPEQFSLISGFRDDMVSILSTLMSSNKYLDQGGIFVSSCRMHCVEVTNRWNGVVRINDVTAAEKVGDWYLGRNTIDRIMIDEASPINSSC